MSIEQYYLDFRSFKDDFIMACPIDQKYECYKVWAQWLIRNLSQNPVNYHIIPDKESIGHDTDIINHIHEKGGHDSDIGFFYDRIKSKCGLLYDQYNTSKFIQFHNSSQRVVMSKMILHETKTFLGKKTHIYRLGAIYVKYEEPIHHKLLLLLYCRLSQIQSMVRQTRKYLHSLSEIKPLQIMECSETQDYMFQLPLEALER